MADASDLWIRCSAGGDGGGFVDERFVANAQVSYAYEIDKVRAAVTNVFDALRLFGSRRTIATLGDPLEVTA